MKNVHVSQELRNTGLAGAPGRCKVLGSSVYKHIGKKNNAETNKGAGLWVSWSLKVSGLRWWSGCAPGMQACGISNLALGMACSEFVVVCSSGISPLHCLLHFSTLNSSLWLFSPPLCSGETKIKPYISANICFPGSDGPASIPVSGTVLQCLQFPLLGAFCVFIPGLESKWSLFHQATDWFWPFHREIWVLCYCSWHACVRNYWVTSSQNTFWVWTHLQHVPVEGKEETVLHDRL